MNRFSFAAILTAAALQSVSVASAATDNRPLPVSGGITFGAYDPHGDFTNDPNSTIEHLFLPWEDVDLSSLAAADDYAQKHNRTLLITIEPWTWSQQKHITPGELQRGIQSGRYDGNIAAICNIVKNFKTPTTIRWAQEMEDTTGRFIWANWKPADYIAAYRKIIGECRAIAPNVAFMWSPKGNSNLGDYYPGDDVVDVIGLSVFGLQANDRIEANRDRTFADLLKTGYEQAAKFGKPIYVAEVGYSGDTKYVGQWAATLLDKLSQYPLLKGVIYFNDRDVIAWPHRLGVPNWEVTENLTNSADSVAQR